MPIVPGGVGAFQWVHPSGAESERASHEAYKRVINHVIALFPGIFTAQERLFGLAHEHSAETLMALLDELKRLQEHHRRCVAEATTEGT